jgi:hypothetical protein
VQVETVGRPSGAERNASRRVLSDQDGAAEVRIGESLPMNESPLTVNAEVGRVGEPPRIAIALRNVSDRPVWVVGVLNGSEIGYRFPHYITTFEGPGPLPEPELSWCGMVAPLRLDDFRRADRFRNRGGQQKGNLVVEPWWKIEATMASLKHPA